MQSKKWQRFDLERQVREYFWQQGFVETRTPLLVQSPGMEPHLKPLEVKPQSPSPIFLPTSPEFGMKKLLAEGLTRIFQLAHAFRDEPRSPDHAPEFTMLEFYEANISLDQLKNRVESLIQTLAHHRAPDLTIRFRGKVVDLKGPWERVSVNALFQKWVGIDLREHQTLESLIQVCQTRGLISSASAANSHSKSEDWNDLYFRLWLNLIEPNLPKDRLVFVHDYPLSQSSLCNPVQDEKGFAWANRFELYLGNFELGNAFDELRDSDRQRKNFEQDQAIRRAAYGSDWPESPIDEALLTAVAQMPPTCGIALGFERLAMLLLEAESIEDVIPLSSHYT